MQRNLGSPLTHRGSLSLLSHMGHAYLTTRKYHHLLNHVYLDGLSYSFNVFINLKNAIPFCLSWLGSILFCMCLCGNVCVCMYVHIWRIEAFLLFRFLRQDFSMNLELPIWARLAGQQVMGICPSLPSSTRQCLALRG